MTRRERQGRGFTLIETLTVIAIIITVMALALPNFFAMMKDRKWRATVSTLQVMVMRARALATNVRKDISVEFDIQDDNGTRMWLESEAQTLERIPDMMELQFRLGGYYSIQWILDIWESAGGTFGLWSPRQYGARCRECGRDWLQSSAPYTCPSCGASISFNLFAYDFKIVNDPEDHNYGDNARQSEIVKLPHLMTIDPNDAADVSPNFTNWDSRTSVRYYGYDDYPDLRIAPNGTLVQTRDPVLCIKDVDTDARRQVTVVRCTGRLIDYIGGD